MPESSVGIFLLPFQHRPTDRERLTNYYYLASGMDAMHRMLAGKIFRIEIATRMTSSGVGYALPYKDPPMDEAGLFFLGTRNFFASVIFNKFIQRKDYEQVHSDTTDSNRSFNNLKCVNG